MRRTVLLVAAAFIAIFVSSGEPHFPLPIVDIARATPSLSGALPVSVPNGSMSGVGLGTVGTPPTNSDFETAGGTVGTPASNYDFATGDFTDWTLTGSPTVQSGGPTGYFARVGSSQKVKSAAFTVDSNAQVLTVDTGSNVSSYVININVYSGGTYATKTSKQFSCSSSCTTWVQRSINAVPWQGQSIKIEVERLTGSVDADNIGVGRQVIAGWSGVDGTKLALNSDDPSDKYMQTSTDTTSSALFVDSNAQNLECTVRVDGTGGMDISLMYGTSFGTATVVGRVTHLTAGSWTTVKFGVGSQAGTNVKVRMEPDTGSSVSVDDACVQKHVIPAWQNRGFEPAVLDSDDGRPFASHAGTLRTGDMKLTFPSAGGTWFKVSYRLKANFNSFGTDAGSTINAYWKGTNGSSTGLWGVAGKASGSPYKPVDVWLEDYFFVPSGVSISTGSVELVAWGIVYPVCNPTCGGFPDIGPLEVVDGPPNGKVTGNPAVPPSALPPGIMASVPRTDDYNGDPVSITSGNWSVTKTDLAIPGKGVPLSWTRSYSAQGVNYPVSPMGINWSHNWDMKLTEVSSTLAVISLPMSAKLAFTKVSGTYTPAAGTNITLVKNGGGTWTMTTADQMVHTFNSAGQWTSVADRNGNTTILSYDGSGKLTTITDPGSRTLTLTYTGSRITSVSDGTRTVSYAYTSGDLTTITDVMGETIAYGYSGHLVTSATDASGRQFLRNDYDQAARVVSQLDAIDGETIFEYDTPGAGATRVTDQRGKQTTTYFDTSHRVTDIVDDDGGTVSFTYDSASNRLTSTNQLAKTWTYTYDSKGNVLTATDPLTKVWTYTYNGRNDVVTVTDPMSKVTTFGYDGSGNLTSVTDADSEVTTFTVNGSGLVTAVTDPLSHATSFGYDSYGNRTTVTNALSKVWTFTYDGFGRVTEVEDPLGHSTTYTYNAANLVLTVTDELSHVTTYTYDENGNVLTVEDANSNVTTYEYDDRNQAVSILDAEDGEWTFEYDEVGNLVSKTNPRGKTTEYTYDDLSRLETETDPLTFVRSYAYDTASRLASRTDPKNQTISYTYNDRNELTLIDYPTGADTTFAYNDSGARTQMVDATGTTTYSYDDLYRLTSVTFPGSRTVGYGYDAVGRRTSMTYPGGSSSVTYGYDAANQLTSVTDWNSNATTYAYDDAGRMTTATLPSGTGIVSTYSYDDADRLTGIEHVKGGSTTLAFVDYSLDDVGNRMQRIDGQGTHTYAYDDVYRLTSVTYPSPSTTTYDFDAFGNRTEMVNGGGTTTYDYDDADRLVQVVKPGPTTVDYEWDDNGNLVERGGDTFTWDYEDRMVSATVNSVATAFVYRGDGLRDSRTTGMTTTTFAWDIASGLPTVIDDGNQYVYGATGLNAMKQGGNWYYYLADGLGSTMAIVNASGVVQNSYTYDVYGEASVTGALANEFDFAGQQTDSTGLQYLRARYMDPETGTFLSRDPIASSPQWTKSQYSYADATPTTLVDPTGLFTILPPCIINGSCLCFNDLCSSGPPPVSDFCAQWFAPPSPPQCVEQLERLDNWTQAQIDELLLIGEYLAPSGYSDGPQKLKGFKGHGVNQAISRENYVDGKLIGYGVKTSAIRDALRNPRRVLRLVDDQGRVSFRYETKDAWVAVNEDGMIVSLGAYSRKAVRWR